LATIALLKWAIRVSICTLCRTKWKRMLQGSEKRAGVVWASWRHFSQIISTEAETNQSPPLPSFSSSSQLCAACAFSENYLHLFNGSSLENSFAHPIAGFLLARFVSIVFDVLCPRFRRIVGAKKPRAKAAENQRRSIYRRKKKNGEENGRERIKTRNKGRNTKRKKQKKSGRVFRDGLFVGVGRERASRRSCTGCLSLIKISRNSFALAKIRRCFPPLLVHRFVG
jgi:hypothetical protein